MATVFIIGCGYIGQRVAALERADGARVLALARSYEAAQRLRAVGIEPVHGDLDDPEGPRGIVATKTFLYYLAPPPPNGVTDPRLEGFFAQLRAPNVPKRVVLVSTTGVYGDCRGAWVTEETPPNPQADRARRRLGAEMALRRWGTVQNVPVVILRVPGIYGPGRLPENRLRAGEPVLREEESPFSNRIHADDLARVCVAAMRKGEPGRVYNVADGSPSTMTDYFYRVADLLKLPRPPAITLKEARGRLSSGILSYFSESKRIDNRRMREELGIELLYPDLASGLPTCLVPRRDARGDGPRTA